MLQRDVDVIEREASIRPADISLRGTHSLPCTFGKAEIESTAGKLILFFQARGDWEPFTLMELIAFYQQKGWDPNFMFFGLSGTWWNDTPVDDCIGGEWSDSGDYLRLGVDGKYYVTTLFMRRCMGLRS